MKSSDSCLQCAAEHLGAARVELQERITDPTAVFSALHHMKLALMELQRDVTSGKHRPNGPVSPAPLFDAIQLLREDLHDFTVCDVVHATLEQVLAKLIITTAPPAE